MTESIALIYAHLDQLKECMKPVFQSWKNGPPSKTFDYLMNVELCRFTIVLRMDQYQRHQSSLWLDLTLKDFKNLVQFMKPFKFPRPDQDTSSIKAKQVYKEFVTLLKSLGKLLVSLHPIHQ